MPLMVFTPTLVSPTQKRHLRIVEARHPLAWCWLWYIIVFYHVCKGPSPALSLMPGSGTKAALILTAVSLGVDGFRAPAVSGKVSGALGATRSVCQQQHQRQQQQLRGIIARGTGVLPLCARPCNPGRQRQFSSSWRTVSYWCYYSATDCIGTSTLCFGVLQLILSCGRIRSRPFEPEYYCLLL